jgi:hypothetical protein
LVEWLNGLPKVQSVLRAKFNGNPITETNLSQWKNGGYAAWKAGERMADTVGSLIDGTKVLQTAAKGGLNDRTALMLAATLANQILRLESMPDGPEKAKMLREVRIGYTALTKGEFFTERLRIQRIKHPLPGKAKKAQTAGERRQTIMDILGIDEGFDGTKNPELTLPPKDRTVQYKPVQVNISKKSFSARQNLRRRRDRSIEYGFMIFSPLPALGAVAMTALLVKEWSSASRKCWESTAFPWKGRRGPVAVGVAKEGQVGSFFALYGASSLLGFREFASILCVHKEEACLQRAPHNEEKNEN